MIIDSLDNLKEYTSLNPEFENVRKFISENRLDAFQPARYEVSENCHALVSEYFTRDISECFIECHRRYIDIQVLLEGKELIGFCNKAECSEAGPYSNENDMQKLIGNPDFASMKPGYFAAFFPQDGHIPQINIGNGPEAVKKIVFKVRV